MAKTKLSTLLVNARFTAVRDRDKILAAIIQHTS